MDRPCRVSSSPTAEGARCFHRPNLHLREAAAAVSENSPLVPLLRKPPV